MKISKAALATATAIASIKGAAAKHRSADLDGVGYDALHINPEATAVINGGTYDARNIRARGGGYNIYDGAYGIFVDEHANTTVCDAKLIKGGTEFDDWETYGRSGVYVGSNATLNIVGGVIEGGDSTKAQNGASEAGASGVSVWAQNEKQNRIVITGGEILGGMRAGAHGDERGESISIEGGSEVYVYGGKIGDRRTNKVLDMSVGFSSNLPPDSRIAAVAIFGGDWKGNRMFVGSGNNGMAWLDIIGDDLHATRLSQEDIYDVLVEGHLCDGSFFNQTITVNTVNANPITIYDCSTMSERPTFEDDCGSGKKKKKKKKSRRL